MLQRWIPPAVVVLALLWSAPATAQDSGASLTPAQTAAIDDLGRRSIDERGAPSVLIAVARNGAFVYRKAFGLSNVENQIAPDVDTRYPIGSNTKQFTATAILMLQDQGKLRIDAPLATYLPEIPHARAVTLRNLLSHTGGYAEFTEIGSFDELGNRPATPAQVVASVDREPLAFTPGTDRQYSNTGYILLQMVIERLSGMRYAEFLRKRIFEPAGMTSTYVREYDDTARNVATEYQSFSLGPWEHAEHLEYTWFGGAGAIISNAADLVRWNHALQDGKLISAGALNEMLTPHKVGALFPFYGFGIMNTKLPNGHRMILHGGNTFGAATQDARFPDDHYSVIVLSNSGSYDYTGATAAIYSILVPSAPSAKPKRPAAAAAAQASALPKGTNPAMVRAARRWLDDAIAGHVDRSKLRADFAARLLPHRLAALRALAAYGKRTYQLVDVDRRPPTQSYLFYVNTPAKKLVYVYSRDDAGTVAGAGLIPNIDWGRKTAALPTPLPSAMPSTAP